MGLSLLPVASDTNLWVDSATIELNRGHPVGLWEIGVGEALSPNNEIGFRILLEAHIY